MNEILHLAESHTEVRGRNGWFRLDCVRRLVGERECWISFYSKRASHTAPAMLAFTSPQAMRDLAAFLQQAAESFEQAEKKSV